MDVTAVPATPPRAAALQPPTLQPPAAPKETLESFLRSDPTFQPTVEGNAFKVGLESVRIEDKNQQIHDFPLVGFWYRDISGFFGNAQHIDVVYMPHGRHGEHAVEHFTLDQIRPGFYQAVQPVQPVQQMIDPHDIPFKPEHAWVAFDLNAIQWDSNKSHNYVVKFQQFPRQPW